MSVFSIGIATFLLQNEFALSINHHSGKLSREGVEEGIFLLSKNNAQRRASF